MPKEGLRTIPNSGSAIPSANPGLNAAAPARPEDQGAALSVSGLSDAAGSRPRRSPTAATETEADARGFGGTARGTRRRGGGRRRSPALSKGDWGPLGKHPDLDAIVARQRLHLPLSGRLTAAQVTQAWKHCAAEHHPDRGGEHDTMQLVNGARDLLLGRNLS